MMSTENESLHKLSIETMYLPQSFRTLCDAKDCFDQWLKTYNATLGDPTHIQLFKEMRELGNLLDHYGIRY